MAYVDEIYCSSKHDVRKEIMYLAPHITAVLGVTNTGKTHYAVERMCAHNSGVIGLPLRLLAREVYDNICAKKALALVPS